MNKRFTTDILRILAIALNQNNWLKPFVYLKENIFKKYEFKFQLRYNK